MKQFLLKLDENSQRPVVILRSDLTALLDTGAFVPVWVADEKTLTSVYGATFVKAGVPFSGFGGVAKGNLYRVTMQVGGLIYPNMPILASTEVDSSFDLILSASMFDGLIYQIDTIHHTLGIDIPDNESIVRHIKLKNSKGRFFILSGKEDTGDFA